jgi:hypothetical protein
MDNLISVPFLRVFGVRCQFADFSLLKPDTRNLKSHLLSNVTQQNYHLSKS